jgi:hypothetical protein
MRATAASPRTWRGPRPRPFLALSILLHLALLVALYAAGPYRAKAPSTEVRQARMTAALEQARRKQMQRQVRAMDEALRKMAAQAGESPEAVDPRAGLPNEPQALLQHAQQLAEKIQRTQQKIRAAELARLLKIKPEEALAKLKAEAKAPPKTAATPAAAIAQLEQQARTALAQVQQQQKQREQGSLIAAQNRSQSGAQNAPQTRSAATNKAGPGQGQGLNAGSSGSGAAGKGVGATGGAGDPSGGGGFRDPRNYEAMVQPQLVNAQTLRVGAGRVLGAGGAWATRVYLNSWYVLGPFEGLGASSLEQRLPPEAGVDLDAAYEGLGQRVLQWQYQVNAGYPFVPQPRAENAVYYAYTEVHSDVVQEVWLEIGADDDSKLWFNDELVWVSGRGDKPWYRQPFYRLNTEIGQLNLVEGRRRVLLRQGRNRLLFKLYNGIDLMFFSVVISPAT